MTTHKKEKLKENYLDERLLQPKTKFNMVIKKYQTSKYEDNLNAKYGKLELQNFNSLLFKIKSNKMKKSEKFFKSYAFYINLLFLTMSCIGIVTLFGTNWFDNTIQKIITLKEDGFVFKLWRDTTADCFYTVHVFNYTNVDAIISGKEKPKLQEVGPYVFRHQLGKWNVVFNGTESVTYSENITNTFMREFSSGSLDDVVILPNFIIIGILDSIKKYNKLFQVIVTSSLRRFPAFLTLTMHEVIFGIDDKIGLIKDAMSIIQQENMNALTGIIRARDGAIEDRITIGTGIPDLSTIGMIKTYNGETMLTEWNSVECNNLMGVSDGFLFPGEMITARKPVYSYRRAICRKVTLVYDKPSVSPQGYPANRYIMPPNMFHNGVDNPENKCYYNESNVPSGIFNIGKCYFDSPLVLSYPHYLYGEQSLLDVVDGLNPDPEKHSNYIDVHDLGIVINGIARMQGGIMLHKLPYYSPYKHFKDGTVLPLTWVEVKARNLTGVPNLLVYHLSHTVPLIRNLFKWISIISFIIPFIILIVHCHRMFTNLEYMICKNAALLRLVNRKSNYSKSLNNNK